MNLAEHAELWSDKDFLEPKDFWNCYSFLIQNVTKFWRARRLQTESKKLGFSALTLLEQYHFAGFPPRLSVFEVEYDKIHTE